MIASLCCEELQGFTRPLTTCPCSGFPGLANGFVPIRERVFHLSFLLVSLVVIDQALPLVVSLASPCVGCALFHTPQFTARLPICECISVTAIAPWTSFSQTCSHNLPPGPCSFCDTLHLLRTYLSPSLPPPCAQDGVSPERLGVDNEESAVGAGRQEYRGYKRC